MRNLNKLTMVGLAICGVLFCNASADAKIWNLPDYLGQQFLSKRSNNADESFAAGQEETKFKCSSYGLVSLASIGADYECTDTVAAPEGCCGSKRCKRDRYPNTAYDCQKDRLVPSGSSCEDPDGTMHYQKCVCDTSIYKYNPSNCDGELLGNSCYDGSYYYEECTEDPCLYPDNIVQDVSPCDPYRCKTPHAKCDSICLECYTDTCDYPENDIYPYKSECNSGRCDSRGHIEGCSERCYACDACDMRDCASEGYLTECPVNTICNDTCIPNSCNSMVYVKPTGCVTSPTKYYSPKTHWCGINYCKQ